MSFLFRKVEDVTTISKSQSLTSVSIKHLESSKQNYYIISLRAIIKAIFTESRNLSCGAFSMITLQAAQFFPLKILPAALFLICKNLVCGEFDLSVFFSLPIHGY